MTANEDVRVDLDRIEGDVNDGWPPSIHDIRALIAELRSTRASIGPDSERARCPACAGAMPADQMGWPLQAEHARHTARAAGLLPGPDDIVVSREALSAMFALIDVDLPTTCTAGYAAFTWAGASRETWAQIDALRAALSQPHPAQEQQT